MTNRTQRLGASLFAQPRGISLERALPHIANHRQTKGKPVITRQAKATAWILGKAIISIREDELAADNRTAKPRAGTISSEMDLCWLLDELGAFSTRSQDRFAMSEEDKQIYREALYPYWEERSMKNFINGQMTEEVKATINTQILNVNQADKGQGHITINYPRLLSHGLGVLVAELKTHCVRQPKNPFYQAVLILLEASQRHILHYAALVEEMAGRCQDLQRQQELLTIAAISRHNAQHRPTDLPQARQLLWYLNIILQYESNVNSISLGRSDQYMLPFYQASLNQDQNPAYLEELLEPLWVEYNGIVLLRSSSSARYFTGFLTGHTALLGGLTKTGRNAVSVLSFLCLDAYQSIQLPQPDLSVRVNEPIDRPFLRKTTETICLGAGIPQIFDNEMVVPAFLNRDVSLEGTRDYAVVSRVRLSTPGRTYGLHDVVMFNLLKVMKIVLQENEHQPDISWDGLICQIHDKTHHCIKLIIEGSNICDIGRCDWAPVPLLSSFIEDYMQHGKDITADDARCNFSDAQSIGIANLSDSLYALKGVIFDQQRLSFDQLMAVLGASFQTPEGEKIRARLINRLDKYSNDIDDADNISTGLLRFYCKEIEQYLNPRGGHFTPGSYTVSAHVPLGSVVGATPDERLAGKQLANGGLSPMVGRDSQGSTAVLKSVSKLDNYLLSNGALLSARPTPATLAGDDGLNRLAGFLQTFYRFKLQHIQFDMVNADTLREVQQRSQDLAGLVVRVVGYSAFFVELLREIQGDTICRTAHRL